MNKLLSIAFMITTYSSLFSEPIPNKKERILKNENGEFFICHEIDNENEECKNLQIEEAKKIFNVFKRNEELVKEVVKNILIAQTRNSYFILLGLKNKKTVLKSTNNNLQEVSKEEWEKLVSFDESTYIEAETLWNELMQKKNNPEYIRSILPEDEQKMFDAVQNFLKRDFTNK